MRHPVMKRKYPDLRTWRFNERLKQVEAAEILGLAQSTYSRLERGERAVGKESQKRIAQRTGVPTDALIAVA